MSHHQRMTWTTPVGEPAARHDCPMCGGTGWVPDPPSRSRDDFLAAVADTYRQAFDTAPLKHVAATFGVGRRCAGLYVNQARQAGLLPATTRGRKAI
jgi:hypothetical protein